MDKVAQGPLKKALYVYNAELAPTLYMDDGSINRSLLRDAMFKDPAVRKLVNRITHWRILLEILSAIIGSWFMPRRRRLVVLDAPLLLETGLDKLCRCVVLVTCKEKLQIARVAERDGVDEEQAKLIIGTQMSTNEKRKRAQIEVENSATMVDLMRSVHEAVLKMRKEYKVPVSKKRIKAAQQECEP